MDEGPVAKRAGPSSRFLMVVLALAAACAIGCADDVPVAGSSLPELGSAACKGCHQKIVESFVQTAHFKTSAQADTNTVKGSFAEGHNVLHTGRKQLTFKMQKIGLSLFQTGMDEERNQMQRERFDIVVGSGRVGQSYLYIKRGAIFQLPVSYLTGSDDWINSPGYIDGQMEFGRVIIPRCLECHSTFFKPVGNVGAPVYTGDNMLGISCAKCHGGGRRHVEYQTAHPGSTRGRYILNPARFSRERRLDNCALCHSGGREPIGPSFAYRPGEKLDRYLVPAADKVDSTPDVHGNQVGLLRRSKCFRSSGSMTCSTCHDVHQQQRDVAVLAQKCLACHKASDHTSADKIGPRMMTDCIGCHMPNQRTRLIRVNTPSKPFSPDLRSHLIGIYPQVSAGALQRSDEKQK